MSTTEKQHPKGRLILIGGKEAKAPQKKLSDDNNQNIDFENGVLEEILAEVKMNPVIEIIPVASEDQEAMGNEYIKAFKKLKHGAKAMVIKNKKEADLPENLQRIEGASIVFFTGGDQVKLFDILGGTRLIEIIKNKYENDEDFIIAGTSSGAMVMSENMIISGEGDEAVLKGLIESKQGFGFIADVVVDTHFLSRGRVSRLAEALLIHNRAIGIGICEDTGLVISDGRFMRAIGSGTVVIMEGKDIKNTNYRKVKDKDPVFIENLTMHILAKEAGYDLQQRKFMVPGKKPAERKEMQGV